MFSLIADEFIVYLIVLPRSGSKYKKKNNRFIAVLKGNKGNQWNINKWFYNTKETLRKLSQTHIVLLN